MKIFGLFTNLKIIINSKKNGMGKEIKSPLFFLLNKKIVDVSLNWAAICAFAFFWSYAYYGTVSFKNINFACNIFVSVILYGIFLTFLLLFYYNKNWYADKFTIYRKDVVVFLSFLIIMLSLSFEKLIDSLVGDQLYHSQLSQRHIIPLLLKLPVITNVLNNFIFSKILYFLSLILISFMLLAYCFFKNRKFITKVILLSLVFFAFRVVVMTIDFQPPLRLFPLWLSSSILSSTDFSFKLPQFLGLVVFMWFVQRIANRKFTFLCSWLLGMTVGTIPLLLNIGTLVDQSIWTAVIWSLLLLTLAQSDNFTDSKWIRWFSLISLFSLMRQTAFIAIIPLFIFFIAYAVHKNRYDFRRLFFVLAPVLFMIPFIIRNLIMGTAANYVPGESDFIPKDAWLIERVWFAISSGIAPWFIFNSVLFPWVIFFFFAFPVYLRNIRKTAKTFVVIIFFVTAFVMFYAIRPSIWGQYRYQAEYVFPFAIMGFYYLVVKINNFGKVASKLLPIGLVCLILHNVFIFKSVNAVYRAKQYRYGYAIHPEPVYDYKTALKAVKDGGYAGCAYIAGVTYGILPEILNGFTIAEVFMTEKLRKIIGLDMNAAAINALPGIKIVLISDVGNHIEIIKGLQAFGWRSWKNFCHDRSRTIIYGMIRGDQ